MGLKLLAAGDVCPGDHYFSLGHGTGARLAAGEDPFEEIAPVLGNADLCIANLEGPLSASSIHPAGPEADVFRGPPEAAGTLRSAGFDLLHVANNHALQHGIEAFRETVSAVEGCGMDAIGIGSDRGTRPVSRTVRGITLGFLGYSFVPEVYLPGQTLYAQCDLATVLEDILALAADVDLVVVSAHWGREGTARPDANVVEAAHAMVDAGATLVLGHHPHWFQPVERVGPSLIAYSLGDLVFDLFWDSRSVESALLDVELDAGGVVAARLVPIRFDRTYRVRLQDQRAGERFLIELRRSGRDGDSSAGGSRSSLHRSRVWEVVRKLVYFLGRLHRGHTIKKIRFAVGKLATGFRAGTRGSKGWLT